MINGTWLGHDSSVASGMAADETSAVEGGYQGSTALVHLDQGIVALLALRGPDRAREQRGGETEESAGGRESAVM